MWCDMVLKNKLYYLTLGGPSTNNGFGLHVRHNTDSRVLSEKMVGLLEVLSEADCLFFKAHHYKSLFMVDDLNTSPPPKTSIPQSSASNSSSTQQQQQQQLHRHQ